jgi:hypothetical protein
MSSMPKHAPGQWLLQPARRRTQLLVLAAATALFASVAITTGAATISHPAAVDRIILRAVAATT